MLCLYFYVCSPFIDFPFSLSQWRDARDALIGQFNCLLSFQPRSQGVLSFNFVELNLFLQNRCLYLRQLKSKACFGSKFHEVFMKSWSDFLLDGEIIRNFVDLNSILLN